MSQKGSTTLRPDSFARGYRDGWADHLPRSDANDSREYARGFEAGAEDRRAAEWMRRGWLDPRLRVKPKPGSHVSFTNRSVNMRTGT